jgi:hypothetical protein
MPQDKVYPHQIESSIEQARAIEQNQKKVKVRDHIREDDFIVYMRSEEC